MSDTPVPTTSADASSPVMPAWLEQEAKNVWDQVVAQFAAHGISPGEDEQAEFAEYWRLVVQLRATFQAYREQMNAMFASGKFVFPSKLREVRKIERRMRPFENRFGLHPLARAKLAQKWSKAAAAAAAKSQRAETRSAAAGTVRGKRPPHGQLH